MMEAIFIEFDEVKVCTNLLEKLRIGKVKHLTQ